MRKIALLVALTALAGCSSHGPQLSQFDADQLLNYATERIESEDWKDASRALETFVFQYPTHPRYQEARYRLGQVYFDREDYLSAASEFARLADDYPNGDFADDARFGVCAAYARVSPEPRLDQEYTRTAITHCESLLGFYPDSEYAPRAREMITELRNKLAEKTYLIGRDYLRLKAYDSAIIYFDDLLEQYPASASAPKALYGLYKAYEGIGYTEDANAARERLLREFPESEEARRLGGSGAGRP